MQRSADSKSFPTFRHEAALAARHDGPVCGIDEAGRGPWAGPVVAVAVILDTDRIPMGLNDSKKLTARVRARLFDLIMERARVGIGSAEPDEIDRDNILRATLAAMARAVGGLETAPVAALVDGNRAPRLPCPVQTLVKGDSLSLSIAAASIIAKVTRDRLMADHARECPGYGWEHNMGYGTAEHSAALRRFGVTRHHRRSFAPVRAVLALVAPC